MAADNFRNPGEAMWGAFVNFWDGLGWLANLIEVAFLGSLLMGSAVAFRNTRRAARIDSIVEFVEAKILSENDFYSLLVPRTKIVIIDDEPEHFPVDYLRRLGFQVTVFEQLSLAEVHRVEPYDVALVDIAGVVPEDLDKGGAELIKRIREKMGHVIVFAVSSKTFDVEVTRSFQIANDVLKKPIQAAVLEDALRDNLMNRHSPFIAATNIESLFQDCIRNEKKISTTRKKFVEYFRGRKDEKFLLELIAQNFPVTSRKSIMSDARKVANVVKELSHG